MKKVCINQTENDLIMVLGAIGKLATKMAVSIEKAKYEKKGDFKYGCRVVRKVTKCHVAY